MKSKTPYCLHTQFLLDSLYGAKNLICRASNTNTSDWFVVFYLLLPRSKQRLCFFLFTSRDPFVGKGRAKALFVIVSIYFFCFRLFIGTSAGSIFWLASISRSSILVSYVSIILENTFLFYHSRSK